MKPHPIAAEIGRTISTTFYTMKKHNISFNAYQVGGSLHAKIPGFFCPGCKKFTPGENVDICAFEREHR